MNVARNLRVLVCVVCLAVLGAGSTRMCCGQDSFLWSGSLRVWTWTAISHRHWRYGQVLKSEDDPTQGTTRMVSAYSTWSLAPPPYRSTVSIAFKSRRRVDNWTLLFTLEDAYSPRLSPTGSHLLYFKNTAGRHRDMHLVKIDFGATPKQTPPKSEPVVRGIVRDTLFRGSEPCWHPDGQRVFFIARMEKAKPPALWMVEPFKAGHPVTMIEIPVKEGLSLSELAGVACSSDGLRLAFAVRPRGNQPGQWSLCSCALDGSDLQYLHTGGEGYEYTSVTWSPFPLEEGVRHLVFCFREKASYDVPLEAVEGQTEVGIVVMNVKTRQEVLLYAEKGAGVTPLWDLFWDRRNIMCSASGTSLNLGLFPKDILARFK